MMDKPEEAAGSQKTPVGGKERTSELRLSLGVAVTFVITTIALGILIGRFDSPKWDNRVQVAKFINSHYEARFLAEGREPLPERDPIELRFRLDDRYLVYRTDKDEIRDVAVPAEELPNPTWRSKENQGLIHEGFALGAPVAAYLSKVHVSLGNKIVVVTLAGGAVLVSGVFLGYYVSHNEDPDFSSKPFQEMRSDKARWRQLAEYHRTKSSRAPSRAAPSATP
jgi:hypothetical protein